MFFKKKNWFKKKVKQKDSEKVEIPLKVSIVYQNDYINLFQILKNLDKVDVGKEITDIPLLMNQKEEIMKVKDVDLHKHQYKFTPFDPTDKNFFKYNIASEIILKLVVDQKYFNYISYLDNIVGNIVFMRIESNSISHYYAIYVKMTFLEFYNLHSTLKDRDILNIFLSEDERKYFSTLPDYIESIYEDYIPKIFEGIMPKESQNGYIETVSLSNTGDVVKILSYDRPSSNNEFPLSTWNIVALIDKDKYQKDYCVDVYLTLDSYPNGITKVEIEQTLFIIATFNEWYDFINKVVPNETNELARELLNTVSEITKNQERNKPVMVIDDDGEKYFQKLYEGVDEMIEE